MSWRDLYCGELRTEHIGKRLTVAGWTDTRRDHGGLVFIDLRDHTGKVQLVINPERTADAAALAHEIRSEFVLQAEGEVVLRTLAELRRRGITCDTDYAGRSMKGQLTQAQKRARAVAIRTADGWTLRRRGEDDRQAATLGELL